MTSIVISYHNEGQSFVEECIKQIHNTCGLGCYEIIVVDDYSDIPLKPLPATIIRNNEKKGVGAVFDIGIKAANGGDIIMCGCDIRFDQHGWASRLVQDINAHRRSIVCTKCITLRRNQMLIDAGRLLPSGYGCNLLLLYNGDILRAMWAPKQNEVLYRVPIIMGACYGFKKAWYNYIDGWKMYRDKGALEAFLSIKNWLFGGECLVDVSVETAHMFREHDEHDRKVYNEIYNKLLLDYWFFDSTLKDSLASSKEKTIACEIFRKKITEIDDLKKTYQSKMVMTIDDYIRNYTSVRTLNRISNTI